MSTLNETTKDFAHRLADVHLFSWGYFGYHLFSMFMMRIFLNSEVFISHFDFWSLVMLAENALIFGVLYLAKRFINNYSFWLVVLGSLALGAVRTYVTTSMQIIAGLGAGIAWPLQLLTGALFELVMVGVWANVNGAFRDHQKVVLQLSETKNSILGYRENAVEILAEEQEKLQSLTRESLLPQIKLIEDAINEGGLAISSRWGVAHELKGLIYNQVKPLSESLRQSAKHLVRPISKSVGQLSAVVSIPSRFRVTNSIFPLVNTITMLLCFLASPLWLLDDRWVLISGLMALPYFAILYGLKKLTANWPSLSAWVAVPLLFVFSMLPVLPAYTYAVLFYPSVEQAALYGNTTAFVSMIVFISLAVLDSFDYGSRNFRLALEEENRQLGVEMTLFEQQLWAARRNWSLVIHGTVQASLTAALTRLNAPDADKKTLDLAKKDLERAIAALSNPPATELNFSSAMKELTDTWQGVCEVKYEISTELKKILARDTRLSMCVNEICKEAISNAVRHGDARRAKIDMQIDAAGLIELCVTNDGAAPSASGRKGLGSALLDELTLDWQLSVDENRDQTVLLAHLPFSGSQA